MRIYKNTYVSPYAKIESRSTLKPYYYDKSVNVNE